MSEEAPIAPDQAPKEPAAAGDDVNDDEGRGEGGGRGCLPVLLGAFLLLVGTFIGTRIAKQFPSADAAGPTTAPFSTTAPSDSEMAAALARTERPPVELHYLIVCGVAEQVGNRLDLLGVVAELWPRSLPSKGGLTVAVSVSAANRDRKLAIRGFHADGTPFIEQELELDPEDPRRPRTSRITFELELTNPGPLIFEVFTDDKFLVGRRVVAVRLRPDTRPTTAPSTRPAPAP